MRALAIVGLIFFVLGVLALSVQSVTYFTTDREIGPLGFFTWDVSRPHTIFVSPIAGLTGIIAGIVLMVVGRGKSAV
jgi:hypothetical protein